MGSFRIVTGSGYNRREITNDMSNLADAYETLKKLDGRTYSSSSERTSHYQARQVNEGAETMGKRMFNSLVSTLERKADKWAIETLAEFQKHGFKMAGLTEVPVTIREMSDEEASIFALIENLQREDLNPVEEAEGLKSLIESYGFTQEEAADRVGKSRTAVTNTLRLLKLPSPVLQMLGDGKITAGHARALLGLDEEKEIMPALLNKG